MQNIVLEQRELFTPPVMVLLSGEVGSGKTTFVRELLKLFKVNDVASPTFALHHRYLGKWNDQEIGIDHFDFYRLQDQSDLESTGFWDLMSESLGFLIIEWPEKINFDYHPENWKLIKIKLNSLTEISREIEILA